MAVGQDQAVSGPSVSDIPWFVTSWRKRALDLLVATAAVILTSPILLAAALAIRLTSPGDILFRQRRVGLAGREFTCLKFRTMKQDADDAVHRAHVERLIQMPEAATVADNNKLGADPRITSVGHFLRRTSLDELPQLFNVLRGEMSIVGPRPALDYEVALYEPWQSDRLLVKPGITGLWQVSGRNRTTHDEMCRLDIAYASGWSLGRDASIILRTPAALIRPGETA